MRFREIHSGQTVIEQLDPKTGVQEIHAEPGSVTLGFDPKAITGATIIWKDLGALSELIHALTQARGLAETMLLEQRVQRGMTGTKVPGL